MLTPGARVGRVPAGKAGRGVGLMGGAATTGVGGTGAFSIVGESTAAAEGYDEGTAEVGVSAGFVPRRILFCTLWTFDTSLVLSPSSMG